jgi:flagellar basal-body rod protein FlgB
MTPGIDAITTQALGLALDGAALRHQAIAANIANHDTPGYVARSVDFEAELAAALRDAGGRPDAAALAAVKPQMRPRAAGPGTSGSVRLDAEVAAMAQNAVQFQVLAKALNRHLSILSMAAGDGKK